MSRPGAPWPTASTRIVALLGWPAGHSLSPIIHNAGFEEVGLDLVYVALPTRPEDLETVVRGLTATGAVGANITVPHKQAVVGLCDSLSEEAELVGAVNTLVWTADGLLGENTDARGFSEVLSVEMGMSADADVTVLGTGGVARAVVVALVRLGSRVTVVGRRLAAAEELAELAGRAGSGSAVVVDVADDAGVEQAIRDAALVVNATPLGMQRERLPAAFHRLKPGQKAYDVVYSPPDTPFLVDAQTAGAAAHHGLGMLVAQAAASFRIWTGADAPVGTMSAAAAAALGHGT